MGGVHAATAALEAAPEAVLEVWVGRRLDDPALRPLLAAARDAEIKLKQVRREDIDAVLPGINHQGVALKRNPSPYASFEDVLKGEPGLVVVLDGITDPQNLGAILRSCWAFGVGAAVVPKHRAVGLTPAAVKTAAGAVDHVPVCRVTNAAHAVEALKGRGYWVWGAAVEGPVSLYDVDWTGPVAIVLGAEGKGLRPGVAKACDGLFRIPMLEAAGSVNVSVAAGITLAWAHHRRVGESTA